jgi:hypothetical protein
VSVAVREASQFKKGLSRRMMAGQIIMIIVLGGVAYSDVSAKWIVVMGFFLSAGILRHLIEEVGGRLDAGRSYMEQWATAVEDLTQRH